MPAIPEVLHVMPQRPAPPENSQPATLLAHATHFGAYVAELENQLKAWQTWAGFEHE